MRPVLLPVVTAFALIAAAVPTVADSTQSLTAQVGGQPFASDHDGITLVPVAGGFTLVALTAGASAWPPPKTRIDRLSIQCRPFAEGQPFTLDSAALAGSSCEVTFTQGHRGMASEPDAQYTLDKAFAGNRFEVSRAAGKTIEGTFTFQLHDAAGTVLSISDGRFVAEDQQY